MQRRGSSLRNMDLLRIRKARRAFLFVSSSSSRLYCLLRRPLPWLFYRYIYMLSLEDVLYIYTILCYSLQYYSIMYVLVFLPLREIDYLRPPFASPSPSLLIAVAVLLILAVVAAAFSYFDSLCILRCIAIERSYLPLVFLLPFLSLELPRRIVSNQWKKGGLIIVDYKKNPMLSINYLSIISTYLF